MNYPYFVKCYRNGTVVLSEMCMSLWEADIMAKELSDSGWYDDVKIISTGENDAKLV